MFKLYVRMVGIVILMFTINKSIKKIYAESVFFTVSLIFLARVDSEIFANGLSAPQHSMYLLIFVDRRVRKLLRMSTSPRSGANE